VPATWNGRDIRGWPESKAQEPGEFAFLLDASAPISIDGTIGVWNSIWGDPVNKYETPSSARVQLGVNSIDGGSQHCDIVLQYTLTKVSDLYVVNP
jgi:hypothetical protein